MRAVAKNRIAVFHPQGFIDGNNATFFIGVEDINHTYNLSVDMILISMKKVVFFNPNGLEVLTNILMDFKKKMKVSIGYCDVDEKKYLSILKFYNQEPAFNIFNTFKTAQLFVATNQETTKQKLLVFSDEVSQRNALAIELFEHGHNPIVAQSLEDFKAKKKKTDYFDDIIEHTYLGNSGKSIAARVAGNAIVYTIKGFLDAEIFESFDNSYHKNCLNVDFKLFIFDANQVVSMNTHALNFFTKLASSAAEYNASICLAALNFEKTPVAYKDELEDAGILFFDTLTDILKNHELLKSLTAHSKTAVKNQKTINKTLVNNLPNFIDATVSSFEMMTNAKAVKNKAAVQVLSVAKEGQLYASSIGFYGDLDGKIMLIFPKSVALKASQLLLDEENPSDDMILDTVAEFVNIIGGRVKAILSEKDNHSVDITLPRTYDNIDDLVQLAGTKKGVQVDFALANEHFTFFLTR